VEWVAYGPRAAQALRDRVAAAKTGDALAPVTVVVPTNAVGVAARRLLGSGGPGWVHRAGAGVAGLALLTVYRLAELLGAPGLAAAGRRPVSAPVLAAAVRRALSDAPGRFGPVADHPATEAALVRVHRELADLDDDSLEALAAVGARAADVVRLHRLVRDTLADRWYTEADLMDAALSALRSPAAADLGRIIVHLPQRLSHPAARLLRGLADHGEVAVIAGTTGVPAADAEVARSVALLGGSEPPAVAPGAAILATEVVSVSDAEDEVRTAVRRLVTAARDGIPLERMALLYPSAEPYARLCHEHLHAAQVPFNGTAVRPLSERTAGRWLLDVLALREAGYRRQDLLDLLAGAPVRHRPGSSGGRVPAGAFQRVSREAGVVAGRDHWDGRLLRFAALQRAEAARLRADAAAADAQPPGFVARLEHLAADADGLRAFALELIGALDGAARLRTWTELVGAVRGLLVRYLGAEPARAGWPEAEQVAAGKVEAALDRLAVLDQVEPEADLETLRRTLTAELDADLGRVGRLGHGVAVGPLGSALGADLDLVIVLGCAEGSLPSRVREDSLLPDVDRAVVAHELPPRSDRVHVEHRHLLAALAAAATHRILSHPRGDLRRSAERPPSRWLLDACAALQPDLPPALARTLPRTAPWLRHQPSFAGGLAAVAFPATAQEHALRSLTDHHRAGLPLSTHPLTMTDAALRRGHELLRGRAADRLTRFDGDLTSPDVLALVPSPTAPGAVTSATRLEAYATCPHRYLFEQVLRVEVVENPEELLEISPLDRGSLVHEVLERWLLEQLAAGVPEPAEAWGDAARKTLFDLAAEVCDRYEADGLVGHPLLWRRDRDRLLVDFEHFLEADAARRSKGGLRPRAAEQGFGMPGCDVDAVTVVLGDGSSVQLRGKIDRLDECDDGRLLVTDYKTGRDTGPVATDDPLQGGTKLQLPIYALAARTAAGRPDARVLAEYWFTSTRGDFAQRGYEIDQAILDRLAATLGVICDGIGAGMFPARPRKPDASPFIDCHYCDPDGLGTKDGWQRWVAKRSDLRLAAYVALVEPEAGLTDTDGPGTDGPGTDGPGTNGPGTDGPGTERSEQP
jgi:ATP-dependent helicase/nuclease subunit B